MWHIIWEQSLLRGIILGVLIASPMGPVGLLCLRRTLERGVLGGLAVGIGAAAADLIFSAVAAFGFSLITDLINGYQTILKVGGGIVLLIMAVITYRTALPPPVEAPPSRGLIRAVLSSFFLTVGNPVTVAGILAVVTGLGQAQTTQDAIQLVIGVGLGSAAWWVALSLLVAALRHHIPRHLVIYINRTAALLLAAFGIYALGMSLI